MEKPLPDGWEWKLRGVADCLRMLPFQLNYWTPPGLIEQAHAPRNRVQGKVVSDAMEAIIGELFSKAAHFVVQVAEIYNHVLTWMQVSFMKRLDLRRRAAGLHAWGCCPGLLRCAPIRLCWPLNVVQSTDVAASCSVSVILDSCACQ